MIRISGTPKTFAEFFAGVGLMRLGLDRAGWKIAFANDLCPDKFEMYSGNFEDADDHFLLEDVHKIKAEEVPKVTRSFLHNELPFADEQ